MRSLGTLRETSIAFSVNTHRRVVGGFAGASLIPLPFFWTSQTGMRRLPTLGGDFGEARYLNEFGNIVGVSSRANGAVRASLWTPTPGPLSVLDEETGAAGAAASGEARSVSCAAARRPGDRSRLGLAALKACFAR